MANKLIQEMIQQYGETFERITGVMDDAGMITASGNVAEIDRCADEIRARLTEGELLTFIGFTFSLSTKGESELITFVEGEDQTAAKYVKMLTIALSGFQQFYDKRYSRNNFIKNLLSDNVLPNEILIRAKELHFPYESPRVVMIIRSADTAASPLEILQSMFPDKTHDFIITMDESNIALVKSLEPDSSAADIDQIADNIYHTVSAELLTAISIGIGTPVETVYELAKSYKDAQVALEVGKVFDSEKGVINYESLGIGRLIYQLPTTLCELFLSEVFKKESLDALDAETLHTIQQFFDNNLNISEASRQLYVHRNTLVYRLDKVQKLTGLDLRIFEHAIVFKIAMMVKKYLDSNPMKL